LKSRFGFLIAGLEAGGVVVMWATGGFGEVVDAFTGASRGE
jgi:hypothetical protein